MAHFLEVPGGRIAYHTAGPANGGLVVLLPGIGETHRMFRFLVPRLAEAGHRVAALDVRGYGESSTGWADHSVPAVAGDVLALIRHLGGPAVVLGHSISAATAIWVAAEAPDEVSGLILVGGAAEHHRQKPWMRAAARLVARSPSLWGMYYASLYPTAKPADFAAYTKDLKAGLRRPAGTAALRAQMDEVLGGVPLRYDEVRARTLIVMGSKDGDFADPAAEARLAARKLAAVPVTVELIEGAGHYPHAEMPAQTAPAILKFLAEV